MSVCVHARLLLIFNTYINSVYLQTMHADEFDLHAQLEDRHWWFKGRREIMLTILRRYLATEAVIVEIGCGTGGNLRELAKTYPNIFGVEIDPYATGHAKERATVPVYEGDYRDILRPRWHDIDAVIMADVIEHVENDQEFVHSAFDNLKPGAYMLITVPAHSFLWSAHDVALQHYRRYSKSGLLNVLLSNGKAELVMFTPFNTMLFPLISLIRLIQGFFVTKQRHHKSDLKGYTPLLNTLLYKLFRIEAFFIKHSLRMPFGCSYLALIRKV